MVPPPAVPPHVIVAEDDVLIGLALRAVLQASGFRVTLAQDGTEALEIDDVDPADAVLTDVNMPRMNGITLTLALRQRHPALPIVILSSSANEPLVASVQNQIFAVLNKPAVASEIRAALQRALADKTDHTLTRPPGLPMTQ